MRLNDIKDKLSDLGEKTQAFNDYIRDLNNAPGTSNIINALTKDLRTMNDWPGDAQKRARKIIQTAFANNLDAIDKIQKYIVANRTGDVVFFMPENIIITSGTSRVTRLRYDEITEIYHVGGNPKVIALRTANAARKSKELSHINAENKKNGKRIAEELNFQISQL